MMDRVLDQMWVNLPALVETGTSQCTAIFAPCVSELSSTTRYRLSVLRVQVGVIRTWVGLARSGVHKRCITSVCQTPSIV